VSEPEDRVAELRERIDANDRALVEAVNLRLRLVAELWRLKDAHGSGRLDPGREQRLREALHAVNRGPLSGSGLDELITLLLALTKRELGDR
jgi:chorismate mutase